MQSHPLVPFNIQSGWLPNHKRESFQQFFKIIFAADHKELAPSIMALKTMIEENEVLEYLVTNAFQQNANVVEASQTSSQAPIPAIPSLDVLLHAFNTILTTPPQFINNDLVGLPFSAIVVGIDATLGGSTLFRLPMFNDKMKAILQHWSEFLVSPASADGFAQENYQWLTETAKNQYKFPLWKKDSETLPYWKSWDSFFTREFINPEKERPIAGLDTNQIICCPNDGSLFCWQPEVKRKDVFWLKDMPYSLDDIFSSTDAEQDKLIKKHKLSEMFDGGYVFQTYLNPYNFHRWWVPVNGKVLFDPMVIPGCFFSKLVLPDYGGATTASLPYLAEANARGLMVIETEDYGNVCCIPLGMSEVSTVEFDKKMKKNAIVKKGEEMGMFHYGGSSFVIIFQNLPDKHLVFMNDEGKLYPQQPPPAANSSATGEFNTNIGSQIGQWFCKVESK